MFRFVVVAGGRGFCRLFVCLFVCLVVDEALIAYSEFIHAWLMLVVNIGRIDQSPKFNHRRLVAQFFGEFGHFLEFQNKR
jgi:hypothetical protein